MLFLVVDVDVFLAAVVACVVVAVVSSLCAHETTNAVATRTAVKPRMNFFIVNAVL